MPDAEPGCDAGECANLSVQTGPLGRGVSGGRLGRQYLARGDAAAQHDVGAAGRDENKAGGATGIAPEMVAKSAPDGTTLLATGMETFAINPSLMAKLPYNVSEFVPVSGYGLSNQILVVPAASPFKTLADVIAAARAKPGELNYATIGLGGSSHINMVLFESMTGLKLTPVHYRGGAPAPPTSGRTRAVGLPEFAARGSRHPVGPSAPDRCGQQGAAEAASERADGGGERRARLRGGELVRSLGADRHAARRGGEDQCRHSEGVRRSGFPREILDRAMLDRSRARPTIREYQGEARSGARSSRMRI